jgi:hypothetical protein
MSSYVVLAGVVLTFATALLGWMKSRQNAAKLETQTEKIAEVHVLVNAQLSAVVARVDQLVSTLRAADVPVPDPPDKTGLATGEPPAATT